jgi:hypothetical protein
MAQEIFPLEMHYDSSAGKHYPSRIFEYKKYYKPWTQEGNQAIDSLIAAGIINPNVNRDRKSPTLFRDMRNITLYPGSGWKFEQTAITRGGVVKIGRLVRETKPGQTFPNNYEIPKNIETELRNQYENIVKLEPRAAYRGRQSDLNAIFNQQARELAGAGVSSIASLRNIDGNLVDTTTNTVINNISRDRDTGADKWGDIFSGVEGGANYGVSFAADGSPIFYPVYEKGKSPLAQIGLGGLESVITPILTVAGIIYGVPGVGNVAGAALGAAAGNSVGQLLATGDVDWDQVIKTAATAAVGAYGTTGYAATVGKAVGVTNAAAAQVVGNAIINSSLSGIEAALTGGNVEKSMLAGAVKGAALVSATNVAEAFLGKDGLASLSKLTTLTADQVANVFTSSLVNGITAEINNTGEFADVFGKSIVSSGVGEKAATEMDNAVKTKLKDNPEIRASVFNATKNITSVGTNAALSGRDVKDAIDKASAGIIISSGQAYRNELDRQEELAEARKKQLGATQQPVMVAGPPSAETLAQIQSQPTVSERLVFSDFVDTEDGGFQQTRVQGTRNDGSIYEYDIFTYEDGKVFYAAYNSDLQSEYFDTRPNLTNRNDLGLTSEEVASRDYTAGIDLRDTSGTGGAGRAVIGGGGAGGGGNAVGFNFIGVDSDGRERYDIDGNSFTLFVVNNQKILRNDKTFVELIPIVRPPNPNDPDPTPVVDLKENPEPKIPPKPEPPPPPEPPPVPLKPGEEAKGTEGVTGKEGEKGVAGGAPSQTPPQFTPEPTPSPAPRPTPAPAPNPRQAEIDAAAKKPKRSV